MRPAPLYSPSKELPATPQFYPNQFRRFGMPLTLGARHKSGESRRSSTKRRDTERTSYCNASLAVFATCSEP